LKPVTFIAGLPLVPALIPAFDPIFDRTAARLTNPTNARLSPDHWLFKTPPHLLPQERSHPTGDFVAGRWPRHHQKRSASPDADGRPAASMHLQASPGL
jgi:hypothetical protein